MSYAIYLRKSRADLEAEANGELETLARHHRQLKELASKLKLPITKEYKEVVSGETISARPQMQELLQDKPYKADNPMAIVMPATIERLIMYSRLTPPNNIKKKTVIAKIMAVERFCKATGMIPTAAIPITHQN